MRIRPSLRRTQSTGRLSETAILNARDLSLEELLADPVPRRVPPRHEPDQSTSKNSPAGDTTAAGVLNPVARQVRQRGGLLISLALHFLFGLTLTVVAVEQIPRGRNTDFTISPGGDGEGIGHSSVFGLAGGGVPDGDDLPHGEPGAGSASDNAPTIISSEFEKAIACLNLNNRFDGSLPAGGGVGTGRGGGKGSKGEGGGSGGGKLGGDGTGVGFFGTATPAGSCVYVVDMSGSMHGRRFRRAIGELNRSISLLGPQQRFFVVMFSDNALPLFGKEYGMDLLEKPKLELLPATAANKEKAKIWLHHLQVGGQTYPTSALKMALDLRPDVVFFLTDGEIPEEVPSEVSGYNMRHIPVHAIEFEQREGEERLRRLSTQNFGTYRYIR